MNTPLDCQLGPASDAKKAMDGILRVAETGVEEETEFKYAAPNGQIHYFLSHYVPEFGPGGEIVSVLSICRDISERKQMENTIRSSRKWLDEAQRIGQMGSWELDIVNDKLTWSKEVYRIFEIDHAVFDASYETFLNKIHPDDCEAVNKACILSVELRIPYSVDHRLLFPDGRIKHVRECWEMQYSADGKPLNAHGTVQDVTSLKNTEEQLKDTQDKLRELVVSRELLREEERKRISWEMHEELGQLLAAMKMRVSDMRTQLPKEIPALNEASQDIIGLIDKSMRSVRDMSSDLRPAVLLHGVVAGLEWLVAEFNKQPDVKCELITDEDDATFASDELTTLVFRLSQEALENVMLHAGVSRVIVSWTISQGKCRLAVEHDGAVMASADLLGDQSLSIFGMRERVEAFGGEMRVFIMPEYGKVIEARFPNR
jgi:signal transduction histidine kinase